MNHVEPALLACYGLYVPVPAGRAPCTLLHFLHEVLGLDPAYVEERIQTIMLDGFVVDHMAEVYLTEGSRLALSAAMPGVVGATLRRDGRYASMRSAITLPQAEPPSQDMQRPAFWVELRCFNAITTEVGPHLLRRGVAVPAAHVDQALVPLASPLPSHLPPLPQAHLLWIQLP